MSDKISFNPQQSGRVPGGTNSFGSIQEEAPQPGQLPGMPLPIGKPVMLKSGSLTKKERDDLAAIGWREGMPIPDNLAEWIERAKQESMNPDHMPPPGDPRTPPVKVPKEVDIKDLPEERRRELQELLKQTAEMQQRQQQEVYQMPTQADPSVAEAIRVASGDSGVEIDLPRKSQQIPDLSRPPHLRDQPSATPQEAPRPAPQPAPQPEPQPEARQEAPTKPAEETASGRPKLCPNCDWDLTNRDVVEVTDDDKSVFLSAILGGKPFQRTYSVFGGNLDITVRSLQPHELDLCYQQVTLLIQDGKIGRTPVEQMESINRFRLCLQLVSMQGGDYDLTFPASYADWERALGTAEATKTCLPEILDSVMGYVASESYMRMLYNVVARFNKLMTRLEANVNSPDFWKAAAPGS